MKNIWLQFLLLSSTVAVQAQDWQWSKAIEGANTTNAIFRDDSGYIYITGSFTSPLQIDTFTLPLYGVTSSYIAKLTASADVVWIRALYSTTSVLSQSVAIDDSGNVYVGGFFKDTLSLGSSVHYSNGGYDVFLSKYSPQGQKIWSKTFGSIYDDHTYKILINNQRLYINGFFCNVGFSPPPQNVPFSIDTITIYNKRDVDVFLSCFTLDGNVVWAKAYGDLTWEMTFSLATNGTNLIMAGIFDAWMSFDSIRLTSNNVGFIIGTHFIAKFDSVGNAEWAQQVSGIHQGASGNGNGMDGVKIIMDRAGNSYVYGTYFGCIAKFGNSPIQLPNKEQQSEYYIAKYSPSGALLWARSGGWPSTYIYHGNIALDKTETNVYITGSYNSKAWFAGDTMYAAGSDVFVAAYDTLGNEKWMHTAGGTGFETGYDLCVDDMGTINVVGYYGSNPLMFDQYYLYNSIAPAEQSFIAKLSPPTTDVNTPLPTRDQINIYPNPNTGNFSITFKGKDYESFVITDISGRQMHQQVLSSKNQQKIILNMELPNGMYFIYMKGKKNSMAKFMVNY